MKLYHYDHCPYCVKARMIFGLKHVNVELVSLLNNDETTPINMVGAKILPILQRVDGTFMPESMDIVRYVDGLNGQPIVIGKTNPSIATWLEGTKSYLYRLAMPRWVTAPLEEFATPSARTYFTQKKEAMIGAFSEQMAQSPRYIEQANRDMELLAPLIASSTAVNGELSDDDIHLFSALRAFSIVRGMMYPEPVNAYRRTVSKLSNIPLHDALAQ